MYKAQLKNAIPQMLLDTFLCIVLILGFLSFLQAYDRGGTLQVVNSTKKHGRAYSQNFGSTQKKNPDWVKINSPEELDDG